MLKSGAAAYDALSVRCVQLARLPVARSAQRWLLLVRLNREVQRLLPLCHTGCTDAPHTLGARLCALRFLLLPELKYEWWESALPAGPELKRRWPWMGPEPPPLGS